MVIAKYAGLLCALSFTADLQASEEAQTEKKPVRSKETISLRIKKF